ncbi:hypothetical protein SLS60_009752 [Paraconiothyrium brasiliense]|uniref:Uncharacterized protein n=1 Tax=Paraconiothyrium brasiliense TaxID=300254 RepID=A0ABR3QSG4_9PLEO
MAFRQQHRPQSSRQISYHEPPAEVGTTSSPQRKRALEASEEWVLFSPGAPSTTARTHTTSTERTPRTAGLSRLSDFGSLDTAARSQDDDDVTCQGTEEGEDLDSLDDGLHAFHEPSEYAGPSSRLQQSGDTVLPTHDGLGTFQPDADVAEHMWQFERQAPRRRQARRRSSVQRRLDALEETEELTQEQERRQRIEQWRLEQSKALLEEIERETRRRRRMSIVSAARSRTDSAHCAPKNTASHVAKSVSDGQSEGSDENSENMSFWQRLTRRVIRDLMGIDEDTLSVIFGESLPDEAATVPAQIPETRPSIDATLRAMNTEGIPDDGWQHRLLERVARELGILVHQLSEHPGAFSTYLNAQDTPEYAGLSARPPSTSLASESTPSNLTTSRHSAPLPTSAHFAPTFPGQPNAYSEASLWGIEEEPESVDPLDSFRAPRPAPAPINHAEEVAREQEYWERELDVKLVFNFLLKRFSSRRPSISSQTRRGSSAPTAGEEAEDPQASARRAAIIRQNHPLVSRSREPLPTSSRSKKREGATFKTYYHQAPSLRNQVLKSSSSVTSQSTKKSKRSGGSGRNYWDLGGSVGSGSVIEGKA